MCILPLELVACNEDRRKVCAGGSLQGSFSHVVELFKVCFSSRRLWTRRVFFTCLRIKFASIIGTCNAPRMCALKLNPFDNTLLQRCQSNDSTLNNTWLEQHSVVPSQCYTSALDCSFVNSGEFWSTPIVAKAHRKW